MSNLLSTDKKWKAAQSNRLRNKNFHAKRRILSTCSDDNDRSNTKEPRRTEENGFESPVEISNSSLTSHHDSVESFPADASSSSASVLIHSSEQELDNLGAENIPSASHASLPTLLSNNEETSFSGPKSKDDENSQQKVVTVAKKDIVTDIKIFASKSKMPYKQLDGLLKALHPHHPELPLSSKTLLGPRRSKQ